MKFLVIQYLSMRGCENIYARMNNLKSTFHFIPDKTNPLVFKTGKQKTRWVGGMPACMNVLALSCTFNFPDTGSDMI